MVNLERYACWVLYIVLFWAAKGHCIFFGTERMQANQLKLSAAINDTLAGFRYPRDVKREHLKKLLNRGEVMRLCSYRTNIEDRVGCCNPTDFRRMYNVKIERGKIVLYGSPDKTAHLPPIVSVKMQNERKFSMGVEFRPGSFSDQNCSDVFDGTLHVISRRTIHKLYHAIGDNYVPLAGQVLLDAVLDPHFLHAPRLLLTGHFTHEPEAVPHMALLKDIATAGVITEKEMEGMCFRRVMWGHASHLLYAHTRLKLGSLVSDFARHHLNRFYDMSLPAVLSTTVSAADGGMKKPSQAQESVPSNDTIISTSPVTHNATRSLQNIKASSISSVPTAQADGSLLRVVHYSREGDGYGRTLQNERKIVAFLNTLPGVQAAMCCDFKSVSLHRQLAMAYHADVIMGIHGAALVHSLFAHAGVITVELKTHYAYESILFPIITEVRRGTHVLIDIRSYHGFGPRPAGKPKPKPGIKVRGVVDDDMIARISRGIAEAQDHVGRGNPPEIRKIHPEKDDYVFGPTRLNGTLDHIMGPVKSEFIETCKGTVVERVRTILAPKGSFHCHDNQMCPLFRVRRF